MLPNIAKTRPLAFRYVTGERPEKVRAVGRSGYWLATRESKESPWALTHTLTALAVARSPRLSDIRSLAQSIEKHGTGDRWTFTAADGSDPRWKPAEASHELARAMLALILAPETAGQRATGRRMDQPGAARLLRECADAATGTVRTDGRERSPAGLWSLLIEMPVFGLPYVARAGSAIDEASPIYSGPAKNARTGETVRIDVTEDEAACAIIGYSHGTCSGPCACTIEPDGQCANGWPARTLAAGLC